MFLIIYKYKVSKPDAGNQETKNPKNYSGMLNNKTLQPTTEVGTKIY